jgi:hypothetical protein
MQACSWSGVVASCSHLDLNDPEGWNCSSFMKTSLQCGQQMVLLMTSNNIMSLTSLRKQRESSTSRMVL